MKCYFVCVCVYEMYVCVLSHFLIKIFFGVKKNASLKCVCPVFNFFTTVCVFFFCVLQKGDKYVEKKCVCLRLC